MRPRPCIYLLSHSSSASLPTPCTRGIQKPVPAFFSCTPSSFRFFFYFLGLTFKLVVRVRLPCGPLLPRESPLFLHRIDSASFQPISVAPPVTTVCVSHFLDTYFPSSLKRTCTWDILSLSFSCPFLFHFISLPLY